MMSAFLRIFIICSICTFKNGMTISCYVCNSQRNEGWCMAMDKETEMLKQNCDLLPDAVQKKVKYTVCRKLVQEVRIDKEYKKRTIRQCGTTGDLECSRSTRRNSIIDNLCHCNQDFCNVAVKNASTSVFISVLVALLAWCNTASFHL